MAECLDPPAAPEDRYLAALTEAARLIEYPLPRERDESACAEMVRAVDGLLSRLARGHGAVDISIGDILDTLSQGDRLLRLGFSGVGDYARERLGIAASTAVKMARFARRLRERPLVRAAVWAGDVNVRAAEAVLPLAVGEQEAWWVERTGERTVRALNAEVRGTGARSESGELAEDWERVSITLPDELRAVVDEAMDIVGRQLGPDTPTGARVEGICQDFLGSHPLPEGAGAPVEVAAGSMAEQLEALKAELEEQAAGWAFLDEPLAVAAKRLGDKDETDPWALDAELQGLAAKRKGWDEALGHTLLVFRHLQGHLRLGYASFGHYVEERLGMSEQAAQQRASVEWRLYELPTLRAAFRAGKLSYEKVRLIARTANPFTVDGWIERGSAMTCIELKRALEAQANTQMCARGVFEFVAARRVRGLLADTFRAVRRLAGRSLTPGECLHFACGQFAETWREAVKTPNTLENRILQRDLGRCQVPGCSRPGMHAHHIVYRSQGGSDDPENLVSLCKAHHLHGVHLGYLRVRGKAPDGLRWELGLRRDQLSLLVFPPRAARAAPAAAPSDLSGSRSGGGGLC